MKRDRLYFFPKDITNEYLKDIRADMPLYTHDTVFFNKLIQEYHLLKYGAEEHVRTRDRYIANVLG